METNNWIEYKISNSERLRLFALQILDLSKMTSRSTGRNVINYQITKPGTSAYANYRSALRERSKAEFFSKLSISVEEADETEMWLDLLISSNTINFLQSARLQSSSIC